MAAALYFHPEAYSTSGAKLMGRNAAGESFLRGFFAYGSGNEFWVQVQSAEHANAFAAAAASAGRREPVRAIDKENLAALSRAGELYYPGPGIGTLAWHRAAFGHGAWSLCGITHTTSSAGAMNALADLLIAPVQVWDAVICTSSAVKNNVTRVLRAQADYLAQRLGATRVVLPQLPVIPLGIHTQDFVFDDAQRAAARGALGAHDGTLVVLFMGRLSFHAKAHPLVMYQALEATAKGLPAGQDIVLVECGWHANEHIASGFREAAQAACPSVRVVTLDGRTSEHRRTAWAGADIFCSLSDNIQETFGIVPIEAMAAGLPVVVSDWDGYRDTVRDGVDGFRVPTLMPAAGLGADLALRHALEIDSYDIYCGHACSFVAVDVEAAAKAFSELCASPELRRRMGEAGRQRAREAYDWAAIIPRYENLWRELAEIRVAKGGDAKRGHDPWPARIDPFRGFASYPTRTLTGDTRLVLVDESLEAALRRLEGHRQLAMVNFADRVLPTETEAKTVCAAAAFAPRRAAELVEGIPSRRRNLVLRSLAWLVKLGILKVCE